MKNFLRVAALAICAIFMTANASAQDNYNATTMGEKVYLETANWGQNRPYNNLCPTVGANPTKTGCGPTAFAILCHYYKWPVCGSGSVTHNGETLDLSTHTYDYDNMLLSYSGSYTDEQATAVATLMRDLGYAAKVGYGTSTTTFSENITALKSYFSFTNSIFNPTGAGMNALYRSDAGDESFILQIKECLNQGYPVLFSSIASDNDPSTTDGRHIFILDGYTENDYFHFNFGWAGQGNGWFTLDNVAPDEYSDYSTQQRAYLYVIPNATTYPVTATATPSSMGSVSINGGTAGNSVSAEVTEGTKATLTAHPVDGYALASWTKNGVIVGTKNPIQVTVGESGNDYVANFDDEANVLVEKDCTFNISSVEISGANGSYCSTWTTSDGIVLSCSKGSEPAYALSTTVNTFFAKAPVGNSETLVSDITYTLTAPEGYVIKSYSFKGKSPSSSYTIDVTVGGNTTNVTNASAGVVISASDINSQSTSFVLGSTYAGRAGLAILEDGVTVTIQSEGGASTPEPTPTTYTVTTTANPAEGGTAKFAVGTGSQKTQGDVNSGETITLYATANTGYNFVNWTLNDAVVGTSATCNVSVSQTANYVANFEANTPAEPTTSLAGKNFRLKEKTTGTYMNIYDNATHSTGAKGGVNVAELNESSDNQIFQFIESGSGYMLQSATGYYINCQAWNVDANSTTSGAVLTLESTENELEYLIHCSNGYFKIGAVEGNANIGKFVYCNESAKTNASVWVLEEVIPSNEKTLDVTFNNATYTKTDGTELTSGWGYQVVTQTTPAVTIKVAETINNFGYTTGVISGVKTPYLYKNTNFILSISEPYKIIGYRMTVRGQDSNFSGDVTYTTNNQPGTVTLNGTTEENISATGLYTNIINIGVGGTAGNGIFITALEITYVEEEFTPLPFKAEIEGWRDNNPNTHLGTITIGGTPMKLTPEHLTASELTMPLAEGTALAFTRKYRGFEFQGFYVGTTSLGTNPTLTAENVAAINETTPLVAKFTATDDVTLFYDDDTYSYRIPAIAKTGNGMLVAVSDYRHNLDDIGRDNHGTGTKRIDLVMRTSTDNGATWSETKTIAAGDNSKAGSYLRAFGDAAVAAYGNNILVMAAAGDVLYGSGTTDNPNRMARIYSTDNGANWTIEEMTTKMYSTATSLFPDGGSAFFGSGKLAVDPNFNGTGNARIYGAVLIKVNGRTDNNFVVYSDDLGSTWKVLGGDNANPIAYADEPKVEILPNGQILLSARRQGGRKFNVFTYGTEENNKANGVGTWSTAVDGCNNGGSNGTNGEIICLDAKRPNGKDTKILLQSQPKGGSGHYERYNVTIWYKEVSADETYTPSSIASGWTQGLEVCPAGVKSAYSAMTLQENGEIAFFFEEAPCYGDDHTKGYSMVYVPLTIEEITNNNFLNPNAEVELVEFDIELTDAQGNIYRETLDYIPTDVVATLTAKYPFITLGENGVTTDNKYTNTVTLPFKVSNAETTTWYNIYWPSYGKPAYYPVYMSASQATDTYVSKVTEEKAYGESSYNTLAYADKLSWAIYSVNNTLTFKFKNKLTGNYIQVTGVATDSDNSGKVQNVKYVADADATAFSIVGGSSYAGDYALKANVNGTDGYLCSTSATYGWTTHYNGTSHPGAWAKFVETPDYQAIVDKLIEDIDNFGEGEGKYVADDAISGIDKDALARMPLNSLNTQKEAVQTVKDSYSEITLSIPVANSGSVKIKNEAVSNKFVQKGEVTIEAVPAAGYYFVNWTKPAAQTSAARTAEARNAVEVVSTDNPYTFNLTDAVSLEANFEQVAVTATLTDGQGNKYIEQLDGFTNGVTKEAIAAKLVEKYPYITLGTAAEGITLEGGDAAYTYTNTVELPFKVTNTTYIWHNIYYPSNNKTHSGYPNYIAALNEDEIVDMAASPNYAYGDNPDYNTLDGDENISWAIYNVDNSFKFIFKNKVTQKYIQVTSVADGNAQNVVYVENAEEATAFTLLKDTGTYNGDYALVANVEDTTGYLCATSSDKSFVTHFVRNNHQGAWVKIVETDYISKIMDLGQILNLKFSAGNNKYIVTEGIQEIYDALQNYGTITLNTLIEYGLRLDYAMTNWPTLNITINPEIGGFTAINGEENVVRKYVPTGDLTIEAVPVEGYHFVKWIDGTNEVETAAYTKNISGGKDDVIALTAEFAINIYNINVTAGEGGSAFIGTETSTTVEHGSEVTLTAVANAGYEFVNWTKGGEVVSNNTNYTFVATANGEYVANFRQIVNCIVTVTATTIGGENGGTVKVAVGTTESNESLVVNKDANVTFTATTAGTNYRFAGWYNENDECVSTDASYSTTITANTTYNAKFIKQVDVRIELIKNGYAFAHIGDEATLTHKVFDYGTTVDIHAVSYSADAIFAYWTLDGTKLSQDADYSFVAEEDSYYFVANFNYKAYIAVVAGDNGTAYIGSEGVTRFEMATGNTVTITAKANSGYVFDHWALIDGSSDEGTTVSTSAVYTLTLKANPNTTVTYKAFFRQITALEDGKAYRIAGKMSDGTLRYIYRDGQNLKWSTTKDETTKSIFIAQSDFNGSLNLISAVGDYGWNYDGDLSHSYATLKTADGSKDGTFTLYAVSGDNKRSYNAYGTSTSNDLNFNTGTNIRKENGNGNCTDMVFEEVPFAFQVSVANGSNAKLGTVNLPFATTVPEGVKVYGVDHTEGEQVYMKALELTNNVLPAKTPVLVEAEKAGKFGFAPAPASQAVHETGFAGTLEAEAIPGTTNAYILSYKGEGTHIMLYKLSSTDRRINANKAYFIEATGKASALQFVFGETTDIEEVEREDLEHTIYDLQGRKLSEITEPGIYIIDGKKVWIK